MNLLDRICAKKELQHIDRTLVKTILEKYMKKHQVGEKTLSPKEEKILIADSRKEIRLYTGRFHTTNTKKESQQALETKSYASLLAHHPSTRERLPLYDVLKKLYAPYAPQTILDIGCGINPLALAQKGQTYYAYDINGADLEVVKTFAEQEKKDIRCVHQDIRTLSSFPQADCALLFKVCDILDEKGHAQATALIRKLAHIPLLLVSFATRSLSGKPFKTIHRLWFERLLQVEGYEYNFYRFPGECFYLARKKNARTS